MKKINAFLTILAISTLLAGCNDKDVQQPTFVDIDEHNIMLNTKPKFVYLDLNDGSDPRLTQVKDYSDETKTEINVYSRYSMLVPSRAGFIFKGFSLDREGGNLLSETETTILDNYSTIYAKWEPVPMNTFVLQEGPTELNVDLGVQTVPIQQVSGSSNIFVPYHYKEVLLQIYLKSNYAYQTFYISGMARDGSNSYSYNLTMPYSIRLVETANLLNIDMLNATYLATDLNRIEQTGTLTNLGFTISVGVVQSFREAYIKIK